MGGWTRHRYNIQVSKQASKELGEAACDDWCRVVIQPLLPPGLPTDTRAAGSNRLHYTEKTQQNCAMSVGAWRSLLNKINLSCKRIRKWCEWTGLKIKTSHLSASFSGQNLLRSDAIKTMRDGEWLQQTFLIELMCFSDKRRSDNEISFDTWKQKGHCTVSCPSDSFVM